MYIVGNNLVGELPDEIGQLVSVTDLYLPFNMITSIPAGFGNMASLKVVYPTGNAITGTIPTTVGLLANMERLNFDQNSLSGTIPTEIGSMTKLIDLELHQNQLTGPLPTSSMSLLHALGKRFVHFR